MNSSVLLQVLSVLLCLNCAQNDAGATTQPQGQHSGLYQGPYFSGVSHAQVLNMSVTEGQTVHLPCHVKQLGRSSLAWVRSSDSTILSIDTDIVTHDNRFRIVQSDNKEDWVLIIRSLRAGDAGFYECQLNTELKMSRFIHLQIMVPVTKIEGAPNIFAKRGSSVELTCSVTDTSTSRLVWYKDGLIIPVEDRADVRVSMTKNNKQVISVLEIKNLSSHKHGQYSCGPDGLSLQNVTLYVIDAKEQGLRTNGGGREDRGVAPILMIVLSLCYSLIHCFKI